MHLPRQTGIPDDIVHYLCITAADKVRLLPDEATEIVPGIQTFWVGVHHRSSMAICIDTAKGTVVASDAFFNFENVEENAPLGIAESPDECVQACDRIRKAGNILLPLYDPDILKRHPDGGIA